MSNEPSGGVKPFARDRNVDKPSIIGARWWHEALVDRDAEIARRTAIRNIQDLAQPKFAYLRPIV